jgi:membrane associated rhomboid family serine protease
MLPLFDENPTLRRPVVTYLLLAANVGAWLLLQDLGRAPALEASTCNLGLVPGELTGRAPVGLALPIGEGLAGVVDREPINVLTPLTSMFLHGGWMHLLGNMLYLWVFGNNVEDSMSRGRFLAFYLLCGLAAAGAQVVTDPASPIPMVGASGAISGVLGAYLALYPRVLVGTFFGIFLVRLPAWTVLIWWFATQLLGGLPALLAVRQEASGGVAFWAHIGGFVAGFLLVRLFLDRGSFERRTALRHRLHPGHP